MTRVHLVCTKHVARHQAAARLQSELTKAKALLEYDLLAFSTVKHLGDPTDLKHQTIVRITLRQIALHRRRRDGGEAPPAHDAPEKRQIGDDVGASE